MNLRTFAGPILLACLAPLPAAGATYFVSTAGSDSNSGSQKSPFRHLSKAASAAGNPGDTVIVMDGTYDNESQVATPDGKGSVVTLTHSGNSKGPITFRAQNRGGAILDGGNTTSAYCSGAWAYFNLRNAAYIVIQGFVIQNTCYNGVRSNDSAHDITLRWNEIRNVGNWANPGNTSSPSGIYINNTEYNFTFDGNLFHDIGGATRFQEQAVYTSAANVTIVNNVFYNIGHGFAIQTGGGFNVTIANNTFAFPNPNTTGQLMLWDNDQAGTLANVTVRNNVFYSPKRVAVVTDLMAPIGGNCSIDHNITNVGMIFDNGSPCTLANNSTGTDPKLVNPSSPPYNFQLQNGSPAIGAGVSASLPTDYRGAPRTPGAGADIGAYQFLQQTISPIASVGSGVSILPAAVAPGQILSIYGTGIGPDLPASLTLDASGLAETLLGATRAVFDGVPAPLIYVSSMQLVAVAPYSIAGQTNTVLEVEYEGNVSPPLTLPVASSSPAIFTFAPTGIGQAAILNQDSTLNSFLNPAPQGSTVMIFATGAGPTDPAGVDGLLSSDDAVAPVLPVTVTVGGQSAMVQYAGSSPGLTFGMVQVNATIPQGIGSSAQMPIVLKIGDNASVTGVTVAVL